MGAVCTRIDVSPEAAKAIQNRGHRNFTVQEARFETVWTCIRPYIRSAVERHKVRRLLRQYLEHNPCRDRYLGLTLGDRRWAFEIMSNRRGAESTEIVLTSRITQNG